MFGMGIGELLIIAVVALLVIGPDKLPEAAKSLSKGIRDLRKQTRELQDTLEDDMEIGDAIRDLKSAFRGDDPVPPPRRPHRDKERLHLKAGHDPSRDRSESATAAIAASAGEESETGAAAGPDEPATPAAAEAAFPEPVIRPPGNTIARGSTGSVAGSAATSPEDAAESPSTAPEQGPTEKKAHG